MARRDLRAVDGAADAPPDRPEGRAKSRVAKLPLGMRLGRDARLSRGVAPEYRRLCSGALALLERYRSILDDYERDFARTDEGAYQRLGELCTACTEMIVPEWQAVSKEALDVVTPLVDEPRALEAAKHYTETVLTPHLTPGPIWRRSYEKPLGYAGDYQVMRYLYDLHPEGHTAYARLAHGLGLEIGAFVRNRMEMMREAIAMTASDCASPTDAVRISSVGCGPAREVVEYLRARDNGSKISFTLIDHEYEALAFASENAHRAAEEADGSADIHLMQVSAVRLLKGLLKDRALAGSIAPQHLIYSVGLFDYFATQTCRRLTATLLDNLVPGGLLIIGNMKAHTSIVWPLEFIADWTLNYRTAEDMLALADLPDAASVELHTEPSGSDYLMFVRKKG